MDDQVIKELFKLKYGDIATGVGVAGSFAGLIGSILQAYQTGDWDDFSGIGKSATDLGKTIYLIGKDSKVVKYSAHAYSSILKSALDFSGKTIEDIKKYSLAKVESLFHIRHEDGTVQFFEQPLDPNVFAKVVLVKEDGELVPLEGQDSMEKIKMVRTNAKKKVFVTNAIRSLAKVSPTGNVRDIEFVVLVGGSALDFEVPTLVTDALSQYNIVAGRGNIRGCEGPRNAVATGLAMSCADV